MFLSKKLNSNQNGMVSILVTMIIMIVISLIVIGFANIIRREQRQALDRQLSTQAFYAAESGINYAASILKGDVQNGVNTIDKNSCEPGGHYPGSSTVDSTGPITFSCLLVDQSPSNLEYSSITTTDSNTIPVTADNSGIISSIVLSWQDTDGGTNVSGCPSSVSNQFTPSANWSSSCDAGVLRADLTPATLFNRAALISGTTTAFLVPQSVGAAGTVAVTARGDVVQANCSSSGNPKICTATISGLSANSYYLRVRSVYKSNSLTVTAFNAASQQLDLIGAQALVDSTGKANDVLRRIVARVPLQNLSGPPFTIQSADSICKRLQVIPGVAPTVDSSDAACQID